MHALDFTTGRAAIAYAGQTPWHGYGVKLDPETTPEEWRIAAGLNWEVTERKIFYGVEQDGRRKAVTIPNRKALLRSDTQDFLSIVSDQYIVAQPSKVFEFFRELLKQQGLALEVAGALDGGKKIWVLARLDDSFTIYGRDRVVPYVLAATSYDTTIKTLAMLTGTRVVCNNTLTAAGAFRVDGSEQDVFAVKHDQEFNIAEAHGKLGLNKDAWEDYKRNIDNLAHFQLSRDEALEYFYIIADQGDAIVRNADNGNVISFPEPSRVTKQFINAYLNGPGAELPGTKDTLWGALNAVTFYQDHLAPAGNRGKRFDSATFGGGARRKQHAFDVALSKFEDAKVAA